MAPRLKIDGPLGKGLKKVLTKRLEKAQRLLDSADEDLETAVHDVRKEFKALRSLSRMIRHLVEKDDYKRLNTHLRDASRELSSLRDVHALSEAVEVLIGETGVAADEREPLRRMAASSATTHDEADPARVQSALRQARALLEPLPHLVRSLDLPQHDPHPYVEGLGRSYREARDALAHGFDTHEPEDLHEARKRVINWRYQLDLVALIWHPVLKAEVSELQALREHLGQHNDVVMLQGALESDAGAWAELEARQAWIDRAHGVRSKLVERSEHAAALLFNDPPKRRAARLEGLWQAARRS
ncbi:CHAD domain-containing protein [Lutibaculum baratangense]|uniref:CHAD domain-containing protein n=1 Tax=Lutibaculum baratangense AMV1 TaxID=631454 RepID=V4RE47_9HYPH|nr:CHAD domain-containing protein [Lutibaculum baratangense]ESR23664.1 hypothetical protein N177_2894 [Lutibaculum baratangense AMV1]